MLLCGGLGRQLTPLLPPLILAANNGLEGDPIEAVRKVLFEASYMVMGLGELLSGSGSGRPAASWSPVSAHAGAYPGSQCLSMAC